MRYAYAKMTFHMMLISFLAFIFMGCGESGTPGGSSGPGVTASIGLSLGNESLPADGSSSTSVTVTLKDSSGKPVYMGTSIVLNTSIGKFSNGAKEYRLKTQDDLGVITVSLIAGTETGESVITAKSNKITQSAKFSFTESGIKTPAFLTMGSSTNTVKSDNSDSAEITAVVLDKDRAPIEGVTVFFSTISSDGTSGAGQISASSLITDENGKAVIKFSSGVGDKRNQIVTVEAKVDGLGTKQIPVQVSGTYLLISAEGETNLEINNESVLKVAVYDAGNAPVFDAPVTLSLASDSTGTVSMNPATGKTDVNGQFLTTITGTGIGTVNVQVESLGAVGTQAYTIDDPNKAFRIIEPTENVTALTVGKDLKVTVLAPGYKTVVFAATLGGWDGGANKVIEKTVTSGEVSATFKAADAGMSTIQVYPVSDPTITDSVRVAISAPSSEASKISFQSSTTVVPPSTSDVKNSVTLIAKVTNDKNQVVKGAPVLFGIQNPTGGGEYVAPAIVFTDDSGLATSIFTSGSLVAGANGVTVTAELIRNGASDAVSIVISGKSASVVIGRSTKAESINNDTAYRLPMSVLVTDANGSPVKQATVSLNLWPSHFRTGHWEDSGFIIGDNTECHPVVTGERTNEDVNKNLILDTGEDINQDAELTPPLSAGGEVPAFLVTDENGVAEFDLIYLKASAVWIKDEITASTVVSGTETNSTYRLVLPYTISDADDCLLAESPYYFENEVPTIGSITVTSGIDNIMADGESTAVIRAMVLATDGEPMAGEMVGFSTTLGSFTSASPVETDASGVARITLKSGTFPGIAVVTATADGFTDQVEVTMTSAGMSAISLTTIPDSVAPGGSVMVIASVKDRFGNPVEGEVLNFQISSNITGSTLSDVSVTSDANGQASVLYTAGALTGTDKIKVTADTNQSVFATVSIEVGQAEATVGSILMSSNLESLPADGSSSATITTTLKDTAGNAVPKGTVVAFSTNLGRFQNGGTSISLETPDATGVLIISLKSGTVAGTALVTATSGGVSQSVSISILASGVVGSITLVSNLPSIPADGTSSAQITATIRDTAGQPVPIGTEVDFSTSLGRFLNGSTTISLATPDATGVIILSLRAGTNAGTAVVTANSGGVTQSVSIQILGGGLEVGLIEVRIEDTVLDADGVSQTKVFATVKTEDNQAVAGAEVTFATTGGSITTPSQTDASGQATATLTSDRWNRDIVTVTASSQGIPASATMSFSGVTMTVTASPVSLLTNETSTITAKLLDAAGKPIAGQAVAFTTTRGTITATATTNASGIAKATTTSTTSGTADITASARNASGTATITYGSYLFQWIGTDVPVLNPGESTSVFFRLLNNGLGENGETVSFSSSLGTVVPTSNVTHTDGTYGDGVAETVLTAGTQTGRAVVDASVTVGGTTFEAQTTVLIVADTATKIVLTPNPATISTSGGVSTIRAALYDANDNPVPYVNVYFRINNAPGGGEYLSSSVKATNSAGVAEIQFYAGSIPSINIGDIEIEASTDPDFPPPPMGLCSLTIAGPVANISVSVNLVELFEPATQQGHLETGVSAIATDINGNPVADGTKVYFGVSSIAFDEDRDHDFTIHCYDTSGNVIPCPGLGTLGINWFSDDVNQDGDMYQTGGIMALSEDTNGNGILDTGEDINGNGVIDPVQGCTIENLKTTTGGIATVSLNYPMSYAANIKVRVTAEADGVSNFYEYILLCLEDMVENGTCGLGY